ncbi:hypothetical protein AWW72_02360 [Acinetobacter sp. NRRL B-65365]|uniref:hypothetical protein n=1 Tax=Acinetobacter sp. NRRL B-65365 TaxID=1785092 RepID=UPI00079FFBFF|nr:hypothetical protein [Acinetobacter sp. NRRL B-65365]KYQ82635.1 hypothetical protein AWW72_02360 [Acinetobacter sp. NRRL B-65365]
MPQYLRIAEKVYNKFKDEKKFTQKPIEYLNFLIKEVRKEIKGTEMKLLYQYIDFQEGFQKPLREDALNIDVSLVPHHQHRDEFILWLAGFIERITIGGKKKLPPILENIPPEFTVHYQLEKLVRPQQENCYDELVSYFKSEEFKQHSMS